MFKRFILFVFFCLSCHAAPAAAASPLLALQQMDQRVAAIGHRLARANRDICERTMPLSGMLVHSLDQYGAKARPGAVAAFGLGAEPAVLAVVPGGAADKAGLRPGDAILSIAGRSFPPGRPRDKASYERVQQVEEYLLEKLAAGPVVIQYQRGGLPHSVTLERDLGCLSRVQLVPSAKRNASADGTYVQLTSRIVEFTRGDDELALVIAHEMAHNLLSHRAKLDAQNVSRGLFKSLDGSAGKIRETEEEADYLALYLLARAGFDIAAVPGFWRRFSPGALAEIFSDGTHPGEASRIAATERTLAEIRMKQRQGLPLVPELVR